MLKLVIFDAGDVLYSLGDIRPIVKSFLDRYNADFERSERIWKKIEQKARKGKLNRKEAHKKWIEELGLPKKALREWEEIDRRIVWRKVIKRMAWVNWMLKKLSRNYKIAVLSDSIESAAEKRKSMERLGIDVNCIDKIFTSYDLGREKPNLLTYKTVLNYFHAKAEEAVFVGHSKDEIEGARKLGLTTISFGNSLGDYFISSLRQLPKTIELIERQKGLRQ